MDRSKVEEAVKKIIAEIEAKIGDDLIPIEASGRHVHLSQSDIDKLFGSGYQLTEKRELSQPGQFLAEETVKLIGSRGIIEKAAMLGPARENSQVELSKTDAVKLGVDPPLRFSGNTKDSGSIFIASKDNVIKLNEGVIIAKRHIHMTPEDAKRLEVLDGEIVSVEVLTERPLIFKNVLIRTNKNYRLNMHIDYDEANACLFNPGDKGRIIKKY